MKVNGKRCLLCDCQGTMRLDAAAVAEALEGTPPVVHTSLCRDQLDSFRRAAAAGEPLLVACTQEAPLFGEIAEAEGAVPPAHANIRERAGWSEQGRDAAPKIAALLAEAAIDLKPAGTVPLRSEGITLVLGRDEVALEAARRLAGRLNLTVVLDGDGDVAPPRLNDVPVFRGRVSKAGGHLGAFEVVIDGFAPALPSSRARLEFGPGADGALSRCHLILDLSGRPPLFHRRDGYFRADPGSATAVADLLLEIGDMVGEFEKPRYVRVNPDICAHSRNKITGCTRCLDACPSGAISPDGDHVRVDPYACSGHGSCASVCPTGAIAYDMPGGDGLFERLRVLLATYRRAGGRTPVLLVHDGGFGEEAIAAIARFGRGLPAHVIPFAVNAVTQIGFDFLATALAYGAVQVRLLTGPEQRGETAAIEDAAELAGTVAEGLGYGGGRFVVDQVEDPLAFEAALYGKPPADTGLAAEFQVMGGRRSANGLALKHLHAHAPAPVAVLPLAAGAPFGGLAVDTGKCTLCLSCVGACPTRALGDNPQQPQLTFAEASCVQCGLCKATCPEKAIALEPRLDFTALAGRRVVVKEEEPFHCLRCGKPFGTQSSVKRMLDRLANHAMFSEPGKLDTLKLCSDCRVLVQFEVTDNPLAGRPRPVPRTTDDYLRERQKRGSGGN